MARYQILPACIQIVRFSRLLRLDQYTVHTSLFEKRPKTITSNDVWSRPQCVWSIIICSKSTADQWVQNLNTGPGWRRCLLCVDFHLSCLLKIVETSSLRETSSHYCSSHSPDNALDSVRYHGQILSWRVSLIGFVHVSRFLPLSNFRRVQPKSCNETLQYKVLVGYDFRCKTFSWGNICWLWLLLDINFAK